MRKLLIITIASLCFGSCANNAQRETGEMLGFAVSDYEYCGDEEVCKLKEGRRNGKTFVTCSDVKKCTDQTDCSCTFWRRKKKKAGEEIPKWNMIDSTQVEKKAEMFYACWCMKKKK